MRWAEEQRHIYIAALLKTAGKVQRADLMQEFRISRSQASLDLQRFRELHPDELVYDTHKHCYVRVSSKNKE